MGKKKIHLYFYSAIGSNYGANLFSSGSSKSKGMGRACGRFQVQVPMGTKIYLPKKKKRCFVLNNVSFVLANLPLTFVVFPYRVTLLGDFA